MALRVCAILLAALPATTCYADTSDSGPGYTRYLSGNPADVTRATRGLVVMQGGGTDVDHNYRRMGELGGGGDFVVLRASGADEYNDYILDLCNCDSVETIVFERREAAFADDVIATIRNAEALFIAGGDQSRYVRFWQGTPVEDAINFVAAKRAPVGGTSAGMAILGEFSYSAMSPASLTAAAGLNDPYHEDLTLARDFLDIPGTTGLVTDQHLIERDRIGRTLALMSRLLADGWTRTARAIAADRETAVHIDPETLIAEVFATDDHDTPYVYFLEYEGMPAHVEPGEALAMDGVRVYRLAPGGRFDLRTWQGSGGIEYRLSATEGQLLSSRDSVY